MSNLFYNIVTLTKRLFDIAEYNAYVAYSNLLIRKAHDAYILTKSIGTAAVSLMILISASASQSIGTHVKSAQTIEDTLVEASDLPVVTSGRIIGKYTLEEKYRAAAGKFYYPEITANLESIDAVLTQRGYETDENLIKLMFFIGHRESHWNTGSKSGVKYGGEYAVGVFQFLPSTFKSVSGGNIHSMNDQINAFITMFERGRLDEFGTLYLPEIAPVRYYAFTR